MAVSTVWWYPCVHKLGYKHVVEAEWFVQWRRKKERSLKSPGDSPLLTMVMQHLLWYLRFPPPRCFTLDQSWWLSQEPFEACSATGNEKERSSQCLSRAEHEVLASHQQYWFFFFFVWQQPAQPSRAGALFFLRQFLGAGFSANLHPVLKGVSRLCNLCEKKLWQVLSWHHFSCTNLAGEWEEEWMEVGGFHLKFHLNTDICQLLLYCGIWANANILPFHTWKNNYCTSDLRVVSVGCYLFFHGSSLSV